MSIKVELIFVKYDYRMTSPAAELLNAAAAAASMQTHTDIHDK